MQSRRLGGPPSYIIVDFEEEIGGTITFLEIEGGRTPPSRTSYRTMPEVETAMRNESVVVKREDDAGRATLFTAASLQAGGDRDDFIPLVVQLSVPVDQLNSVILERWLVLLTVFAVVLVMALVASVLVSRSIIKPLYTLRESALRLSEGDLNHRVEVVSRDEIGAVAVAFNEMAAQV